MLSKSVVKSISSNQIKIFFGCIYYQKTGNCWKKNRLLACDYVKPISTALMDRLQFSNSGTAAVMDNFEHTTGARPDTELAWMKRSSLVIVK